MLGMTRIAALLLIFASMASAQTSPAQDEKKTAKIELTPEQKSARLDQILQAWEARMTKTESFSMKVIRKETEPVRKTEVVLEGTANIQKPSLALFDLQESGPKASKRERFLADGKNLFQYDFKTQQIKTFALPKGNGIGDNLFFSLLSGMKAEDAKERFVMKYLLEDTDYAYIDIVPKKNSDKQEFKVARLTLVINSKKYPNSFMLPRQIYYIANNGETIQYDLLEHKINKEIPANYFKLIVPNGWKLLPEEKQNDGIFRGASRPSGSVQPGGLKQQ
ncbi:TIGR03009 domain-containing protein [Telmatocola sphagniphila]|uniref:TIGR03009 domain-containing protein n=1 Tax=Telmatocola sphagniphila TaxID=1123043 RepID=A0A8E6B6H4_9BACT|nr:TIGR03009 domain-containing protein [Telmatocola sphagniphila]QVL32773.1 TIGR03009 domain-containing protein [Telmatocola sphagniphila]